MSFTVVSYGGGVDSTAMIIGLINRCEPIEYILFADTGGERPETYTYIQYFNLWLAKYGKKIVSVYYTTKDGNRLTLEQDVINNNTIPAIAFGWKTCSQKFKIAPQEKWLKENAKIGNEKPIKYIGFEKGEERRVKDDPNGVYVNRYPLIDWGWTRERCKEEILKAGLCLPPKSSCFFCPNMKAKEVLRLTDDLKERVKKIEANATKLSELKGLGRTYKWTDLINADQRQYKIFDEYDDVYQSPCECIE